VTACVAPAEHRAVIRFGVLYQPRVLFGVKELVSCHLAVTLAVSRRLTLELLELLHDLILTGLAEIEAGDIAVRLCVLAKVLETAVASTSPARGCGIHFL